MNVLDLVETALGMEGVFKGYWPDQPDSAVGLFEYQGAPPEHHFGGTDFAENVQVRSRDLFPIAAYNKAVTVAMTLNHYNDGTISILQTSPVLDIGKDSANPPRHEFTVNFEIRRY